MTFSLLPLIPPPAPRPDADALALELHEAGHLRTPEWPPAADTTENTSRWIAALQIAGGWLAAIFLLLFLGAGAAPFISNAAGWLVIGLLITAGTALALMRVESGFLRQFLFALALAGHGALIVGATTLHNRGNSSLVFFMVALYEAVLLVWVAWMPHRLVAALVGGGALVATLILALPFALLRQNGDLWCACLYWFAACLLWLREPRWLSRRHADAIAALACALGLLSLWVAVTLRSSMFPRLSDVVIAMSVSYDRTITYTFVTAKTWWLDFYHVGLSVLAAVNAVFIVLLARDLPRDARHLTAIALLLAALALTWNAPAVGMGAVALALGFARGRAWLMWLGGAALVYGVSRFYYDLNLSLLHKSGLMVLGGFLLLAVRALIARGERS